MVQSWKLLHRTWNRWRKHFRTRKQTLGGRACSNPTPKMLRPLTDQEFSGQHCPDPVRSFSGFCGKMGLVFVRILSRFLKKVCPVSVWPDKDKTKVSGFFCHCPLNSALISTYSWQSLSAFREKQRIIPKVKVLHAPESKSKGNSPTFLSSQSSIRLIWNRFIKHVHTCNVYF